MTHDLRDASFESFGNDMFQALGFVVDLVPRISEGLDQKGLEKSVVTEHFERHSSAATGQPNTAVGGMLDKSELSESPDHFGYGCRSHLETASEGLSAHSTGLSPEQKDLLEVVLLGLRQLGTLVSRRKRLG
jgi:hypothetical protein